LSPGNNPGAARPCLGARPANGGSYAGSSFGAISSATGNGFETSFFNGSLAATTGAGG